MQKIILLILATLCTAWGLMAQNNLPGNSSEISSNDVDTIHNVDTIQDNAIVYPESMTEKLSDLLRD